MQPSLKVTRLDQGGSVVLYTRWSSKQREFIEIMMGGGGKIFNSLRTAPL